MKKHLILALMLFNIIRVIIPVEACLEHEGLLNCSHLHLFKEIDLKELQILIAKNTSLIILDARSVSCKNYDGQRIPGSKILPSDATADQISKIVPNKDSLIVVYSADTNCSASMILAETLIKMGYTHVLRYKDGLAGWISAGNLVH